MVIMGNMGVLVLRNDLKRIMEACVASHSICSKQTTSLIGIDDIQILKKLYNVITSYVEKSTLVII